MPFLPGTQPPPFKVSVQEKDPCFYLEDAYSVGSLLSRRGCIVGHM